MSFDRRAWSNKRRRDRYRNDPTYRARALADAAAQRKKNSKDPEYKKLVLLRSRRHKLRVSIEFHHEALEARDKELLQVVKQIARLEEKRKA